MCDVIGVGLVSSNPWILNDKTKSLNLPSPLDSSPSLLPSDKKQSFNGDSDQLAHFTTNVGNGDMLPYGPGFVQKLRERYLKVLVGDVAFSSLNGGDAVVSSHGKRPRAANIYNRRTASCDELSSDSPDCHSFGGHNKVAKCTSDYSDQPITNTHGGRLSFKSTEDLRNNTANSMHMTDGTIAVVKPSHSISELKERFESRPKNDEKNISIKINDQHKKRDAKKYQESPSKKCPIFTTEFRHGNTSIELEFLKVAKKLKHVKTSEDNKMENTNCQFGSSSRLSPPPPDQKKPSVPPRSSVNSRECPVPVARTSVSRNCAASSDGQFFTVASYNDSRSNGDNSPNVLYSTSSNGDRNDNVVSGDFTDTVIFRFKDERNEDGDLDDNDPEATATTILHFEFTGSAVMLEKSNISKGNRKSSNMLNLAFDSNYPVAYTYVEEAEADDWSPGVHLHFVDYKALCLRLKRERLMIADHTENRGHQDNLCSSINAIVPPVSKNSN